jgi:hypothetical protein
MSLFTPARLTSVELDGVSWEFASIDTPGACDRFGWCDSGCTPGHDGETHVRYIASAMRSHDSALVEISVGQWKANPAVGLRDTGSSFAVNQDRAPLVGIGTYPDDRAGRHTRLTVADATTLAEALRIVGHVQFADALNNAAKFARTLTEESKR